MKEAKIKLTLKPCGDCWLHIDAPSGLKASINLGQCGSMNDNTIVGRVIREVAALNEDKPNDQVELAPKSGSESKNGVVGG